MSNVPVIVLDNEPLESMAKWLFTHPLPKSAPSSMQTLKSLPGDSTQQRIAQSLSDGKAEQTMDKKSSHLHPEDIPLHIMSNRPRSPAPAHIKEHRSLSEFRVKRSPLPVSPTRYQTVPFPNPMSLSGPQQPPSDNPAFFRRTPPPYLSDEFRLGREQPPIHISLEALEEPQEETEFMGAVWRIRAKDVKYFEQVHFSLGQRIYFGHFISNTRAYVVSELRLRRGVVSYIQISAYNLNLSNPQPFAYNNRLVPTLVLSASFTRHNMSLHADIILWLFKNPHEEDPRVAPKPSMLELDEEEDTCRILCLKFW